MNRSNAIINELRERARAILQDAYKEDMEFVPVLFVLKNGAVKKFQPVMFFNDEEKTEAMRKAGKACSGADCTEMLIVLDSCYWEPKNEKEDQFIKENWSTEKPSTYPENMQKNMLVLVHIDFMNGTKMDMLKYEKGENREITFVSEELGSEGDGPIHNDICFGFMMSECKKMTQEGYNPDDALSLIKDKYPELRKVFK